MDKQATTPTTSAFELEEILNLLRICFATATATANFQAYGDTVFEKIVYDSTVIRRFWRASDNPPHQAIDPDDLLRRQFSQSLMCDHFALCMSYVLGDILRQHGFQATTRWVIFDPNPRLVFVYKDAGIVCPKHSVMEITLNDGRVLYFDGTGEQFGWSSSSWLLGRSEFLRQHVRNQNPQFAPEIVGEQWEFVREFALDGGFMSRIIPALWAMLMDLDWGTLEKMSPCKRARYVSAMATELRKGHNG
ncbi:hypothetical protein CFE70_005285 [Pyrenophora teres f. teres 0-1]|uniref:Uncharacterized protein n=2 Tax=Pyrenophora teres f. teres TaxID=97479 RepID=E3S067_PYRTT|nr:hypothetical protein PTT_15416 [Pyrenophora teres f. teres 0-1]KAE8827593.1 hypothetical protein HRS9122_09574 [Pyrenophora teres f. teres]KAE8839196.1 hypothetical protein HRS9139_03579 [Pyrenophora teres f. teres]KAK1909747.1 hypothetical protein P3342_007919 [Pyrenophora teres f. teres]CAE7175190.1 hypothetical protein PTTW11_05764 [Pyrenophora teres f. teres]